MAKILTGLPLHKPISETSLGVQFYEKLKTYRNNSSPAIINVETNMSMSYQEIFDVSCKLSQWMRQRNLKKDDVILMSCPNVLEYFVVILAALYSNIIVANSNPTNTQREIRHAVGIIKPKLVICTQNNKICFSNLSEDIEIISIETIGKLVANIGLIATDFVPQTCNTYEQVAFIMFSSGTSGLSKAVMLTHRNYNARLNQLDDHRLEPSASDSVLLFLPFFHSYGFCNLLTHLYLGKTVYFMEKFEATALAKAIHSHKITMLPLVPPVLIQLTKMSECPLLKHFDVSSVKVVFCGAAPLSANTEAKVGNMFPNAVLRQTYGLTETTFAATIFMSQDDIKLGSCGTVMPGTKIMVRDPRTGAALKPNEVGEFCYQSEFVAKGYMRNPEATKESFTEDGFLRTGDMCYYDENGYIFIVDRLKEMIKFKGMQIAPAELEALIMTHREVSDVAVIGKYHDIYGEVPLAFVVRKTENVSEFEIMEFVKERVAPFKRLKGVHFIGSIPKSSSGKILRRELRDLIKVKHHL